MFPLRHVNTPVSTALHDTQQVGSRVDPVPSGGGDNHQYLWLPMCPGRRHSLQLSSLQISVHRCLLRQQAGNSGVVLSFSLRSIYTGMYGTDFGPTMVVPASWYAHQPLGTPPPPSPPPPPPPPYTCASHPCPARSLPTCCLQQMCSVASAHIFAHTVDPNVAHVAMMLQGRVTTLSKTSRRPSTLQANRATLIRRKTTSPAAVPRFAWTTRTASPAAVRSCHRVLTL